MRVITSPPHAYSRMMMKTSMLRPAAHGRAGGIRAGGWAEGSRRDAEMRALARQGVRGAAEASARGSAPGFASSSGSAVSTDSCSATTYGEPRRRCMIDTSASMSARSSGLEKIFLLMTLRGARAGARPSEQATRGRRMIYAEWRTAAAGRRGAASRPRARARRRRFSLHGAWLAALERTAEDVAEAAAAHLIRLVKEDARARGADDKLAANLAACGNADGVSGERRAQR